MSNPVPSATETENERAAKSPAESTRYDQPSGGTVAPTLLPAPGYVIPEPPPVPSVDLPERIGRYNILRLLGKGGMGAVYLAHDSQLGRPVALKVPRFSTDENPEILERFYREARTAARLQHPHICPVFDVDCADGTHYLTMAYIEGVTLGDVLRERSALPEREAAGLVRTIALALEEAHRQGIIHRDLKPSNIMIDKRGEPIVMDFGLAREIRTTSPDLSSPGAIMGTPSYMAPEQARGDSAALGPGCDIYSLGVLLYHLLVGELPFQGTVMEVIAQHLHNQPPAPTRKCPGLDARLEAVCLKAMAKEPSQRFLSMDDFALALQEFLSGKPVPRTASTEQDPLEPAAAEALVLFRTWGWETGIIKVRGRLRSAGEESDSRLSLLLNWLEGQTNAAAAKEAFGSLRQFSALRGWVLLGQVFAAKSKDGAAQCAILLDQAEDAAIEGDSVLRGAIIHQRGVVAYWRGQYALAMNHLHNALELLGSEHFVTGRVLDTLGMVYWGKNNFDVARELYQHAIHLKKRFEDERSLAVTYGLLGRLYLDWDMLDKAQEHFQLDLQLAQKCQDAHMQALVYNELGRAALIRGQQESEFRTGVPQKHWKKAAEWFDASIRGHQASGSAKNEGFARKDRALICLLEGNLDGAREHLSRAASLDLFRSKTSGEGVAKLRAVEARLAALQGNTSEALRLLHESIAWMDDNGKDSDAARIQLEIARTLRAAQEVPDLVTQAYLDALHRAEDCRRENLVRAIEQELRGHDVEAYAEHVFRRVRGPSVTGDTGSLSEGASETATCLFVNLSGFISYCQGLDSGEVMRTLNQLLNDLGTALEKRGGFVTSYLGGGFMALVRGVDHAGRAVQAALDLIAVVEEFNRPRAVLGLKQLPVRIGAATGSMYLGNIGTYHKMDFTAVGPPVNLASRLMREARPQVPCISKETWELLGDHFTFAPDNPRVIDRVEIGRPDAWDVLGRKQEQSRT